MLEILITNRVELKIWKNKEKEDEAGYQVTSLEKRSKSLVTSKIPWVAKTSGA